MWQVPNTWVHIMSYTCIMIKEFTLHFVLYFIKLSTGNEQQFAGLLEFFLYHISLYVVKLSTIHKHQGLLYCNRIFCLTSLFNNCLKGQQNNPNKPIELWLKPFVSIKNSKICIILNVSVNLFLMSQHRKLATSVTKMDIAQWL